MSKTKNICIQKFNFAIVKNNALKCNNEYVVLIKSVTALLTERIVKIIGYGCVF